MNTRTFATFLFALVTTNQFVFAEPRTVTLTIQSTNETPALQIQDFETFRIVSAWDENRTSTLMVMKDGKTFSIAASYLIGFSQYLDKFPLAQPISMKGPAQVSLKGWSTNSPGFVTIEIAPESFPPDKTIMVPPGTNRVEVSFESSTNLVHWNAATNGVYGSPDEARFFRIKATKLN